MLVRSVASSVIRVCQSRSNKRQAKDVLYEAVAVDSRLPVRRDAGQEIGILNSFIERIVILLPVAATKPHDKISDGPS